MILVPFFVLVVSNHTWLLLMDGISSASFVGQLAKIVDQNHNWSGEGLITVGWLACTV